MKKQCCSKTKDLLLDKAQDIIMEKGFAATSVEEICKAANVTKGAFFHYFKSKDVLGQELITRFCCKTENMCQKFLGQDPDPLNRIYYYIDTLIKYSQDPSLGKRGCLLGTFAQELSEGNEDIRSACCHGFDSWATKLSEVIADSKKRYAPQGTFDPKEIAEHFIAVVEGSLIMAKSKQSMQIFEKNLQHFKQYLRLLLGK